MIVDHSIDQRWRGWWPRRRRRQYRCTCRALRWTTSLATIRAHLADVYSADFAALDQAFQERDR